MRYGDMVEFNSVEHGKGIGVVIDEADGKILLEKVFQSLKQRSAGETVVFALEPKDVKLIKKTKKDAVNLRYR